jgi:hypothetical protein
MRLSQEKEADDRVGLERKGERNGMKLRRVVSAKSFRKSL